MADFSSCENMVTVGSKPRLLNVPAFASHVILSDSCDYLAWNKSHVSESNKSYPN